jgi:hypothetical protein
MSVFRSDMSGLSRICPAQGQICPVSRKFVQQKSRSRAKTIHLSSNKLTISKIDNMKFRKITKTIKSNLNSSI